MLRVWLIAFACCLAWCLLGVPSAFAQEAPAATPPIVLGNTDVPYPPGATGDAVVVLELVVETDGSVSEVQVVEGTEPFAAQAESAVRVWRFTPAQRGVFAIAARIRVHIAFHEPAPPPAPLASAPLPPTPTPAPPAAAASAEPVLEVNVQGERREIGETTLSAADVRDMPGAFGDAFRAVEALPGVTPLLSGVPYFYVRGAPPNNNGYFLDGVRVPLLFHAGLGPSVIHSAMLERVEFYPGAAPASYGGFAGGIIAGQTRGPAATAHGEASLRLVDAGALLESPFAEGRGSVLVAGRYGYPGPVLSALSDVELDYWDYQARVSWKTSERDMFTMFGFGSHDYLGHRENSGLSVEDFVSDFHRLDLRYDHTSNAGHLRVATTLGYDTQGANPIYMNNHSAALRLEFEQRLLPGLRLRGGADGRIDAYDIRHEAPVDEERGIVPSSADPPPTNITAGVHLDAVWRVVPRVEVVPGARVTLFDGARARSSGNGTRAHTTVAAVDPRLSARISIAQGVAWLSSFGIAHQYPVLRLGDLPAPIASGSGFPEGSSELQQTLQLSHGLELTLPEELTVTATGFLSSSKGLTDLTASCLQIEPPSGPPGTLLTPDRPYFCPSDTPVSGHGYGLELLVRRPLGERWSGWLSYTLSRSVRQANFLTLDGDTAQATVPSDFDRTHVLNAVLAYDLGRRWRAGARFVFYSGAPYSKLAGNIPVPPYNSLRDPAFLRLDVRLEKRWQLGQESWLAFVLEGQNVTLSKDANALGLDCTVIGDPSGFNTRCTRDKVGPITIPSIGLEAIF